MIFPQTLRIKTIGIYTWYDLTQINTLRMNTYLSLNLSKEEELKIIYGDRNSKRRICIDSSISRTQHIA